MAFKGSSSQEEMKAVLCVWGRGVYWLESTLMAALLFRGRLKLASRRVAFSVGSGPL